MNYVWATIGVLAVSAALPRAASAAPDDAWLDGQVGSLVAFFEDLHRNPELSFREVKTAERLAAQLREAGAEVTTGVGRLGVVGVMKNGDGPTVLVRTDMDALPVTEATGLPYASTAKAVGPSGDEVGVMHACGHDAHMTCLVGLARWLAAHKDRWAGTVVLIGQPAEELVSGAREMLADGLYTRFPRPDAALALHVAADLPAGQVGYISGPAMAGSTSLDVVVKGKGGHGAMPHGTADPILLAATLVVDLQSIVSREVSPTQPAVVTVGAIHGGNKHNIIPDEVRLQLSVRAFSDEVRDLILSGIGRRLEGLALAHKAPAGTMTVNTSTPPTVNTPELVAKVLPALKKAVGDGNVVEIEQTTGSEDFGLFGQGGVPTFMFRLGVVEPGRFAESRRANQPLPGLHSAQFAVDPGPSIRTGVKAMAAAVARLMPPR